MGGTTGAMATRALLAIAFLACGVSAKVGGPEAIVPETSLEDAGAEAFGKARDSVEQLMQQGNSTDECKDLADSAIAEIIQAVRTDQDMLNALPTGVDCKNEGQTAVVDAEAAKKIADDAAAAAANALTEATGAMVTLASQSFISLHTATECAWIHEDEAYKTADAHYNTCVTNKETADTNAVEAQRALDFAISEAERLYKECACRTQHEHAGAWASANSDSAEQATAWTQAHNMLCVVASTTYENCHVPPVPQLDKPVLPADVLRYECGEMTPPPTMPLPTEPLEPVSQIPFGEDPDETLPGEEPPVDPATGDKCVYTSSKMEQHFQVNKKETVLVTTIKPGYEKVWIDLTATADIDMVLQKDSGKGTSGEGILVAYEHNRVHYEKNWCLKQKGCSSPITFTDNNAKIRACTDQCADANPFVVGPYHDGQTYTIQGVDSFQEEYVYLDKITEPLNVYVNGYEAGSGTIKFLYDCPSTCTACSPLSPA